MIALLLSLLVGIPEPVTEPPLRPYVPHYFIITGTNEFLQLEDWQGSVCVVTNSPIGFTWERGEGCDGYWLKWAFSSYGPFTNAIYVGNVTMIYWPYDRPRTNYVHFDLECGGVTVIADQPAELFRCSNGVLQRATSPLGPWK